MEMTTLPGRGPAPLFFHWLGQMLEDTVLILVGSIMVVLVFSNVVTHLFNKDIAWTTELCEFLMVWGILSGRSRRSALRGAHDHHRISGQARRQGITASRPTESSSFCVLHRAGAAYLVRPDHSQRQLGKPTDRARLAHGLPVYGTARGIAGLSFVFVAHDLLQIIKGVSRAASVMENKPCWH